MKQREINIMIFVATALGVAGTIGGLGWNIITYQTEQYKPEIHIKEKANIELNASNSTESYIGLKAKDNTIALLREELYSTRVTHTFIISSPHNMIATLREPAFALSRNVQNFIPEDLLEYLIIELDIYRTSPALVKEGGTEVKIDIPIRARIPVASVEHGWSLERHKAPTLLGEFSIIVEFRDVQTGEIRNERIVSDVLYRGGA